MKTYLRLLIIIVFLIILIKECMGPRPHFRSYSPGDFNHNELFVKNAKT